MAWCFCCSVRISWRHEGVKWVRQCEVCVCVWELILFLGEGDWMCKANDVTAHKQYIKAYNPKCTHCYKDTSRQQSHMHKDIPTKSHTNTHLSPGAGVLWLRGKQLEWKLQCWQWAVTIWISACLPASSAGSTNYLPRMVRQRINTFFFFRFFILYFSFFIYIFFNLQSWDAV